MSVLVTGGAGYIGAHVVRRLVGRGDAVVIVDDLSTGVASRVAGVAMAQVDLAAIGSTETLTALMRDHDVDAVVHLAAKKQVGESVALPTYYFRQNVGGLVNLLDAMHAADARQLVFSSSAAVYGNPTQACEGPVDETVPPGPISPYGETKLVGEWLCRDAEHAWGLRWCALRYFNVVGAGADDLGDCAAQNLVPLVFDTIDRSEPPTVFGDDYPTPDGTGVRDYVHVIDLADSHLAALDWLRHAGAADGPLPIFNVGTGRGSSVREVLAAIADATGLPVEAQVSDRRVGDPASLVADVRRIERELGWRSRHTLSQAVASAWAARQAQAASSA
ncbi:UDP-glucose 4-epimerase GalE [Nocardioides sp. AN3]